MFMQIIRYSQIFYIILLFSCTNNNNQINFDDNNKMYQEKWSSIEDIKLIENKYEIPKYYANIFDLNGTWQPIRLHNTILTLRSDKERYGIFENEYSWGIGKYIVHHTYNIDITASIPFFETDGDGSFKITEMVMNDVNEINIKADSGYILEPQYCWFIEVTFYFINKNTLWIESEQLWEDISPYRRGNLFFRYSGPAEQE